MKMADRGNIFGIVPLIDTDWDSDTDDLTPYAELKDYSLDDPLPELFNSGDACGLPYSGRQEQQKETQRQRARLRKAGIRRATGA